MLRSIVFGLALLSSLALAGDPAVDAFKAKFAAQEQILLSGVLTDPAQLADFAKDAAGGGNQAAMTKWYGRISAFSSDYLSKQHGLNDKAPEVRYMVEPAEWNMLMDTLRKLKTGGMLDQAKLKVFVGMIDDANDDLKRGDPEAGHKVVAMGRKNLSDALNEYLASPNGKAGTANAARDRQDEEARKKAAQQPAPVVTQPAPVTAVKTPPKKTEEEKPAAPEITGDDALAKQARDQAEAARKELAKGGNGDHAYENGKTQTDGVTPVVVDGGNTAAQKVGLAPAGSGKPNLVVSEPPKPAAEGDDMAELHKMKDGVKGHKTLWATIGGGVLGGILGGLIGFFLGGPIGLIIGAGLGAAGGAFGGRMLGKKLWG